MVKERMEERMKEMLEALVKGLVDFPDKVSVTEVPGEKFTTLELRVDPSDMGKIMGLVSPKLKGRADISQVSKIIKEKLSNL